MKAPHLYLAVYTEGAVAMLCSGQPPPQLGIMMAHNINNHALRPGATEGETLWVDRDLCCLKKGVG